MLITVIVHPVNTLAHPSQPPGFRWAVHLGDDPKDLSSVLNAGWAPDQHTASILGEGAAVVGIRIARMCGVDASSLTRVLDHDPTIGQPDLLTIGA